MGATLADYSADELAVEEADSGSGDLGQEELEEPDPNPEPVAYTGTDFDVEGLVRRLERGDIVIPTFGDVEDLEDIETDRFQRHFVWRRPQMAEQDNGPLDRLAVLDGQPIDHVERTSFGTGEPPQDDGLVQWCLPLPSSRARRVMSAISA